MARIVYEIQWYSGHNVLHLFGAVALPTSSDDPSREEIIKAKERAILMLGETLSKYGFAEGMKFDTFP